MPGAVKALVLLFCLGGPAYSQERSSFTVGTASAARGQKTAGVIEVPASAEVTRESL